jgi:hypothetical protein
LFKCLYLRPIGVIIYKTKQRTKVRRVFLSCLLCLKYESLFFVKKLHFLVESALTIILDNSDFYNIIFTTMRKIITVSLMCASINLFSITSNKVKAPVLKKIPTKSTTHTTPMGKLRQYSSQIA